MRNSQAFLNASIKTNHADLAFLPQTSAVNRYISAENIEDKNSHLGPMVQLLFHQMMKSNPGILQIVLVNNKQEEELQAGDGIDPFSPISPTNKAVLKLMQSQAERVMSTSFILRSCHNLYLNRLLALAITTQN